MDQLFSHKEILILLKIAVAHILTDFPLQPGGWVKSRKEKRLFSPYLYIHGLVTGMVILIFLGFDQGWKPALFIMIFHLLIDLWKSYQKNNLSAFLLDQFFHLIIIIAAWLLFFTGFDKILSLFDFLFDRTSLWILVFAFLFVIWPSGLIVNFATRRWRLETNEPDSDKGLYRAGQFIGILERILILIFILLHHFEAIGFLIAAKSVFRFGEIRDFTRKAEAEYILVGTLISFTLAIITGSFTLLLISGFS
jgi:hypothetical protein